MSSKSRINLKTAFASGTAATQSKFEDLIDSSFNTYQDSVLLGPSGQTGTNGLVGPVGVTSYNGLIGPSGSAFNNGLLGPTGATHYLGLWLDLSGATPGSSAATGSTGQVVISGTSVYVCGGLNSWILIGATTTF
jgi:hypothetical protein